MQSDKYKIGVLADISGVSAQTIRRYEEMGILVGKREENNYRMYDPIELCTVLRAKMYRNYGFSLDELDLLFNSDIKSNSHLFSKRREKMLDEIKMLECKIACMDEQQKNLMKAVHPYTCEIVDRPELLVIYYRSHEEILDSDLISEWAQFMPIVRPFVSFEPNLEKHEEIKFKTGLCIPIKYLEFIDLPMNDEVFKLSSKKCISSMLYLNSNGNDADKGLRHVREYCTQNNLKMTGLAYGSTFYAVRNNKEIDSLTNIWIEFEDLN